MPQAKNTQTDGPTAVGNETRRIDRIAIRNGTMERNTSLLRTDYFQCLFVFCNVNVIGIFVVWN